MQRKNKKEIVIDENIYYRSSRLSRKSHCRCNVEGRLSKNLTEHNKLTR